MPSSGSTCSVACCKNRHTICKISGISISFHRFPNDARLRNEWIKKCYRKDVFNPENKRICSVHFLSSDYEDLMKARLMGYMPKKLNPNAIPSLLLLPTDEDKKKCKGRTLPKNCGTVPTRPKRKKINRKIIKSEPDDLLETTSVKPELCPSDSDDQYNCDTDSDEGSPVLDGVKRMKSEKDVMDLMDYSPEVSCSGALVNPTSENGSQTVKIEIVDHKLEPLEEEESNIPSTSENCSDTETGSLKTIFLPKYAGMVDRPFKCKQCNYASTKTSHLKSHVLAKHYSKSEFSHKCLQCNYCSPSSSNLNTHIRSKHCGKRDLPFKCEQCDYSSAFSSILKRHKAKHGDKEELPFKCIHCKFSSAYLSSLKLHIMTKHGDKSKLPYKCGQCKYTSANSSTMRRHVLSKHGKNDLPFNCKLCQHGSETHFDKTQ